MNDEKNNTTGYYAKKSFERKQAILKKAKKMILFKGFYRTTMKDIANDNNISRQMLYKYFPSFNHLVFEIQIDNVKLKMLFFAKLKVLFLSFPPHHKYSYL